MIERGLKRRWWYVLVLVAALAIGVTAMSRQPVHSSPVPLNALEATVEQGAYLARAGNCLACHTADDGQAYAGGLAFKTPFGTLYSTNITPDPATGLGDWSFADFHRAMKQGLRPDGQHLYPAFPYTDYARLTDEDIASLFLYLQSLEPVRAPARDNVLRFPYSQRALLAGWKWLFHTDTTLRPDPARSDDWNRGAYLVEGPGHCGACHTPRNALGAEKTDWALSGGVHEDRVKLGFYRRWSAVNLTGADTGLASWSEDDIVAYLKTGKSRKAIVHGPMREVILHSTSHLTDADLKAMAVYLKSLPPIEPPAGPQASDQQLADGELVYTVHCGSCHLPTGLGSDGLGVTLHQNPIVQAADPASLINVILYGPHLPEAPFSVDRSPMKMFGKRLSDVDIAAVATYLRANFGNRAGAVTPAQVEAQR